MRRRNGPADKLDTALDGRPVEVDGDLASLIETYSLVCVLGWGLDRPATTPTETGAGMASVAELVHEDALRRLAGPIGYRQGVDLAVSGCVQLVSFAPVRVTARVEDLVLQHVELRSTRSLTGKSGLVRVVNGRRRSRSA